MKVKAYFDKLNKWKSELTLLREVLLEFKMDERIKWGIPCYSFKDINIVAISGFKEHYGIWFFQGVFLKDEHNLLSNAQEGKTKAMRQMRFTSADGPRLELVKEYVKEAVLNAQKGMKLNAVKKQAKMPKLLNDALQADSKLAAAFETFSRGKKTEFKEYINEAKRESTKKSRLEKIRQLILNAEGLNDRYKRK